MVLQSGRSTKRLSSTQLNIWKLKSVLAYCSVLAAYSVLVACSVLAACSLLAYCGAIAYCSLLASHQQDPSGYN